MPPKKQTAPMTSTTPPENKDDDNNAPITTQQPDDSTEELKRGITQLLQTMNSMMMMMERMMMHNNTTTLMMPQSISTTNANVPMPNAPNANVPMSPNTSNALMSPSIHNASMSTNGPNVSINASDSNVSNAPMPINVGNTSNITASTPMSTNATDNIPRPKPKKPLPSFNGDKTNITKYEIFKVKLFQYIQYYDIVDINSVLCDALTDYGLTWYINYIKAHPDVIDGTYEDFIKILDKEFLNPLSASKYLYQYQQMKQIDGESINELCTRIENLAIQAGLPLRTDEERKFKLYSLLPYWLQESQASNLLDKSTSYQDFVTYIAQTKEIHDRRTQLQRHTIKTSEYKALTNNINSGCKFCKKSNHDTAYCSYLLRDIHLKKPDAIKFWNDNKLEEQLRSNNDGG
jgi:hypothetical protein